MKKRIIFFGIIIAVMCSVILTSCEKEELPEQKDSAELVKENNPLLSEFANVVAKSVDKIEGREFIKKEVLKQFDGDYDMLMAEAIKKPVTSQYKNTNGITFGQLLNQSYSGDKNVQKNSSNEFNTFMNKIIKKYPLLQIAVPEVYQNSPERWDIEEYTPLVAFLPNDYDEQTTKTIPAYDASGKLHLLDAKIPPEKTVVVVSQNERLIVKKKGADNEQKLIDECTVPYYETNTHIYLRPIDCGGIGSGGGSGGGGGSTGPTDSWDNLNKAKITNHDEWKNMEGWPANEPEFKLEVFYYNKEHQKFDKTSKSVTGNFIKDRAFRKDKMLWVDNINIPIIIFDTDLYGKSMKYVWIEKDPGGHGNKKETWTTTLPDGTTYTSTITWNKDSNDESGYDQIVYPYPRNSRYGEGQYYNTGRVEFYVNFKDY